MQEIRTEEDCEKLQRTLDRLVEWANRWAMSLNVKKCKILHVSNNNPGHRYNIGGELLQETDEESDIGIVVHKSLKPARNCQRAAAMAGTVLRQITKKNHYRDKNIFKKLYCQYVRPHLEFATPPWSPWQVANMEVLERVQKRAVGLVQGLRGVTYDEKCREIGLDRLTTRRERADMIQVFKIMNKID